MKDIREAHRKEVLIRVLSVYADDSTDEEQRRVFALAGVMGTKEEWNELEHKWAARTGGVPFHATDCESGWGVYRDIPEEERRALYKDLTNLLAGTNMLGYGIAIDLVAHSDVMKDPAKDAPYFFCFHQVIAQFIMRTRQMIPQQKVKFTFDINQKVRYNVGVLYDWLTKHEEYKDVTSYVDREISFETRKIVGIQVVDLFAFETMKRLDNTIGPTRRSKRVSLEVLQNTGRFQVQCMRKTDFESFRSHFSEQRISTDNKQYKEWLSKNHCIDTTENRTRYLMYLDKQKR